MPTSSMVSVIPKNQKRDTSTENVQWSCIGGGGNGTEGGIILVG